MGKGTKRQSSALVAPSRCFSIVFLLCCGELTHPPRSHHFDVKNAAYQIDQENSRSYQVNILDYTETHFTPPTKLSV
jgi:hypothetical protein